MGAHNIDAIVYCMTVCVQCARPPVARASFKFKVYNLRVFSGYFVFRKYFKMLGANQVLDAFIYIFFHFAPAAESHGHVHR